MNIYEMSKGELEDRRNEINERLELLAIQSATPSIETEKKELMIERKKIWNRLKNVIEEDDATELG